MFARNTVPALVVASLLPLALACQPSKEAEKKQEEQIPNIQVNLPPSPNFDEGKAPLKYDDGAWSVYGLRQNLEENLKSGAGGTEIEIRGWVQDVYVPKECDDPLACAPGKQPHVWITDFENQQGKKRAMMVVNYRFNVPEWEMDMWKGQPEVILEKNKQYTFKGKFLRFSATGFAHDQGLLEFIAYKAADPVTGEMVWVYPPGAAWHPVIVEKEREQTEKIQKKQAADAEKEKKKGK